MNRPDPSLGVNLCAFLDTIAASEIGPDLLAASDNGYNVIVGSTADHPILFGSYLDHPRRSIPFKDKNGNTLTSTAAGRYQVLARYFDAYKTMLRLPDFSPHSQDLIAIQLIRECHALDAIEQGQIEMALSMCKSRWASLPGSGYAQHENKADYLIAAYKAAGGVLA